MTNEVPLTAIAIADIIEAAERIPDQVLLRAVLLGLQDEVFAEQLRQFVNAPDQVRTALASAAPRRQRSQQSAPAANED